MADPIPGAAAPAASAPAAAPAAPKPAASPAPASPAQPSPAAAPKPGVPATPAPGTVPISALMEEREKRQALQTELENLKTTVTQIQQRQQAPSIPAAPLQSQEDLRVKMDKLWQEDPRKAVQMEISMATQWSDNVNAQVDSEASTLAGKYKDFNDYRDTAMRYVRALPLDQRARPGIVEMAYLVTRGQNVDHIIETQRAALQAQFLANPAAFQMPAGASAGSQAPAGGPQATEAQIRAAGAMKIPIEQYMKWVK